MIVSKISCYVYKRIVHIQSMCYLIGVSLTKIIISKCWPLDMQLSGTVAFPCLIPSVTF